MGTNAALKVRSTSRLGPPRYSHSSAYVNNYGKWLANARLASINTLEVSTIAISDIARMYRIVSDG